MTVPEVLASLAVAAFFVALAALVIDDLLKACGRMLAENPGGSRDPRRTPVVAADVNSPRQPPAGVVDWQTEGWVA